MYYTMSHSVEFVFLNTLYLLSYHLVVLHSYLLVHLHRPTGVAESEFFFLFFCY